MTKQRKNIITAVNDKMNRLTELVAKQNKWLDEFAHKCALVVQPGDEWYEVIKALYTSYGFTIKEEYIKWGYEIRKEMQIEFPKCSK